MVTDMSNIAPPTFESESTANLAPQLLLPREVPLGGPRAMLVRRTLPHRSRRMIGPWCFVDHYGPATGVHMDVPPHPHTGLQTVSWLLSGQIRHNDNLGYEQLINPGELNLMTAGRAIAHAEVSESEELHGIQLWVVLPEQARHQSPHFEHHDNLPKIQTPHAQITVIMGEVEGHLSPAASYWPMVGAEITLTAARVEISLNPEFEYGLLAITDDGIVNDQHLPQHALLDLGSGLQTLAINAMPESKFLLIGGAHFTEEIVMWWNFIGRSHDEIEQMRQQWQKQEGYPPVEYPGAWLAAPELPTSRLKARGA